VEKTIHGNPPCIMLANSIRIINRLETAKQLMVIEQFNVVWVTVNSPGRA
jgi:hypothetical protein